MYGKTVTFDDPELRLNGYKIATLVSGKFHFVPKGELDYIRNKTKDKGKATDKDKLLSCLKELEIYYKYTQSGDSNGDYQFSLDLHQYSFTFDREGNLVKNAPTDESP